MFSLVIVSIPQFCQPVLAPSKKAHPKVFVAIRLSWKGVSNLYCASLVDVSERARLQSSTSMDKGVFLLIIMANSHSITLMSYAKICLASTLSY